MPVLQFVAPILPVRNMERSVAFYRRLGFHHQPYSDGADYAFLSMDGHSLHLNRMADPEFSFNPCGVYFYMDDVDSFYAQVQAAGVTTLNRPEDKPWGVREFAVSDPDESLLRFGHLLEAPSR